MKSDTLPPEAIDESAEYHRAEYIHGATNLAITEGYSPAVSVLIGRAYDAGHARGLSRIIALETAVSILQTTVERQGQQIDLLREELHARSANG